MNRALATGLVFLLAQVGLNKAQSTPPKRTPTPPHISTHPPPITCPKSGKDFHVQMKVIGEGDYTTDMMHVETAAFQDAREKLYDCALQTYADYDNYQDVILLSIENTTGGFILNFAIRFTKEGNSHLNRLMQLVQSGKFCDIKVSPKFVKCDVLDETLLYPYGAAAANQMG